MSGSKYRVSHKLCYKYAMIYLNTDNITNALIYGLESAMLVYTLNTRTLNLFNVLKLLLHAKMTSSYIIVWMRMNPDFLDPI